MTENAEIRICWLLKFRFDGGRKLDDKTLKYARRINRKFPYQAAAPAKNTGYDYPQDPGIEPGVGCDETNPKKMEAFFYNMFREESFRTAFEEVFGAEAYAYIEAYIRKENYYPLRHVFAAIPLMEVYRVCSGGCLEVLEAAKTNDFFAETWKIDAFIDQLRIDLIGEDYEIDDVSDPDAEVTKPKWLQKEGLAYIIRSEHGSIDFTVRSNQEQMIRLILRGAREENDGIMTPLWVDLQKMSVNEEIIFETDRAIWHNRPYRYSKRMREHECLNIHVEWKVSNAT